MVDVEILGDLALVIAALVDRDANVSARAGHGLGLQPCQLALDVEIADLAEVEKALIEVRPFLHAAAEDVVRQMVDIGQTMPNWVRRHGLALRVQQRHEVDVIDADVANGAGLRSTFALPAVNEIDQRVANALDGRNVQFHRAGLVVEAPGAQVQRALVRVRRIVDAEGNRADRWAVQPGEALCEGIDLGIDDEVDAALAVQRHVFVAMPGHGGEAHGLKQLAQGSGLGGGEFDEFESVGAHRVVPWSEGHDVSF